MTTTMARLAASLLLVALASLGGRAREDGGGEGEEEGREAHGAHPTWCMAVTGRRRAARRAGKTEATTVTAERNRT